jgi:glycosyltransferase involved in cell wall biosynthesis/SAM-dependent methyltransferase
MRLAYFSPLPPSKSGIADYSAELLPYLARGARISVFVVQASELRFHQRQADFAVYDVAHFEQMYEDGLFDLCLYHQGNNPHHEYIYERALATPGVVVLHEHCLHHLIAWKTLGRENKEGYWDEMFYDYGRTGSRIAEMRARDVCSEYQQFLLPLNRRLVEHSLGLIVHNQHAASQLEGLFETSLHRHPPESRLHLHQQSLGIPVEVIPHHLSPRVQELDGWDALECRRALGLPEDRWIIASLGFVTQSKRIPTLLAAFRRLLAVMPQAMCLIVGEDHWKWSVAPLIEEMDLADCVRLVGYTSERDFFRYLKAVDVVVNLRYPTAGETSGTLIRALGAGKPTIVSDFGQFAELPDETCLKVAPGPEEERDLYAQLRKLAYRPTLREQLGRAAAAWAREHCDINRSAARYLAFAERVIHEQGRLSEMASRQRTRPLPSEYRADQLKTIELDRQEAIAYVAGFFTEDAAASGYIRLHADRIIDTVRLVPVGNGGQRLLELSSYLQMTPLIKRFGRYHEIAITNWWPGEPREKLQRIRHAATGEELSFVMQNVDVERDRFPYPDEHFDVALCCELIEHLTEDPMHMLTELNRVLKWGGLIILTTPNIASAFSLGKALAGNSPYVYGEYNLKSRADRHSREYTPMDVRNALESAGFKVIKLFTKDLWSGTDEGFLRWLDQTGVPRELRGDNIFAVGRKASAQIERYPDGLYD